jgi:hypothetical protein
MRDSPRTPHPGRDRLRPTLILPEWMEAGMLGAVTVVLAFLIRDAWIGEPLHTPSVMGMLLVEGIEAARHTTSAPGAAALYNGVHFALWMLFGLAAARAMRAAEDDAAQRWMPVALGLASVAVLLGFEGVIRDTPLTRLHLWWGGVPGLLATGVFLIWRHPGAIQR